MEKANTNKFGYFAWILFALAILNFFNTGILRFYVGAVMCLAVIVLLLTNEGRYHIKGFQKITFFSLLIFTFIYSLNVYLFKFVDFSHFLMYSFSPACFYIAGYYLANCSTDNRYKYLVNSAIIISLAIFGFLCVFYTINTNGTIVVPYSGSRAVIDFWTGDILNATMMGIYISLGIGTLVILFIKSENKFASIIKILLLIIFLMCLYCEYYLANRAAIVIGIVTLAATITIIYGKSKEFFRIIFWVGVFAGIIFLFYNSNFLNLKNIIINSPFAQRFSSTSVNESLRFKVWDQASHGLIDHPEGGRATILESSAAHNLWLDIGWDAGVIAFIFAVIFTISSIINFINSVRQKEFPPLLKAIVISMLISFILSCAIEPIIEGVFTYFLAFCFFMAFASGLKFEKKQEYLPV